MFLTLLIDLTASLWSSLIHIKSNSVHICRHWKAINNSAYVQPSITASILFVTSSECRSQVEVNRANRERAGGQSPLKKQPAFSHLHPEERHNVTQCVAHNCPLRPIHTTTTSFGYPRITPADAHTQSHAHAPWLTRPCGPRPPPARSQPFLPDPRPSQLIDHRWHISNRAGTDKGLWTGPLCHDTTEKLRANNMCHHIRPVQLWCLSPLFFSCSVHRFKSQQDLGLSCGHDQLVIPSVVVFQWWVISPVKQIRNTSRLIIYFTRRAEAISSLQSINKLQC